MPNYAICFYMDGNQWYCVFGDFENLQESPAGFGKTMYEAIQALLPQQMKLSFDNNRMAEITRVIAHLQSISKFGIGNE